MKQFFLTVFAFVKIKIKFTAEHRAVFWIGFFTKIFDWGAGIVLIWLLIRQFKSILSWNEYEVMFLYSFSALSYAFAGIFIFHSFVKLPRVINQGQFDFVLISPINPFIHLVFKSISFGYAGNIAVSLTAISICVINLNITLTLGKVLYFFLMLFGSILIQMALRIITAVPSFWLVKSDALYNLLSTTLQFTRYPISVFTKGIQILLTFILPVAFINFYPLQHILDKQDYLGFNPAIIHMTPVVGIVLFIVALLFFALGVRNYKSTGS